MLISSIYQVHALFNFSQTVPKLHYFPNCKGPGPIPDKPEKILQGIDKMKYFSSWLQNAVSSKVITPPKLKFALPAKKIKLIT